MFTYASAMPDEGDIRIVWTYADLTLDTDPAFEIERSVDSGLTWASLNPASRVDGFVYSDADYGSVTRGSLRYRVVAVIGDTEIVSDEMTANGDLTAREFTIASKILAQERTRLSRAMTGRLGWLMRRRTAGVLCTACVDPATGESLDPDCSTCYGTGVEGGFYPAVECRSDYFKVTEYRVRYRSLSGSFTTNAVAIRLPAVGPWIEGDMWIDRVTNKRYLFTQEYQTVSEVSGVPLIYEGILEKIEPDSVFHDVDPDADSSSEETHTREYDLLNALLNAPSTADITDAGLIAVAIESVLYSITGSALALWIGASAINLKTWFLAAADIGEALADDDDVIVYNKSGAVSVKSAVLRIWTYVQTKMGAKSNTNPLNHDRYADSEVVSAMGVKGDSNPLNHDRYADSEAVSAMSAKGDTNPLNHDRYTDGEASAAAPTWYDASAAFTAGTGTINYANGLAQSVDLTAGTAIDITAISNFPTGTAARMLLLFKSSGQIASLAGPASSVLNGTFPGATGKPLRILVPQQAGDVGLFLKYYPEEAS